MSMAATLDTTKRDSILRRHTFPVLEIIIPSEAEPGETQRLLERAFSAHPDFLAERRAAAGQLRLVVRPARFWSPQVGGAIRFVPSVTGTNTYLRFHVPAFSRLLLVALVGVLLSVLAPGRPWQLPALPLLLLLIAFLVLRRSALTIVDIALAALPVPMRRAPSAYDASWRQLRFRMVSLVVVFFALVLVVPAPARLLGVRSVVGAVFLAVYWWYVTFPCPRCQRPFFRSGWFQNPFSGRCLACDLAIGDEPEQG